CPLREAVAYRKKHHRRKCHRQVYEILRNRLLSVLSAMQKCGYKRVMPVLNVHKHRRSACVV
ncbi:hypothetical protein PIB30_063022, partial [Stylosanthes scabra]|nr:hypothetical protein [Stylosanthes scabra]